jgi:Phage integrase family
MGSDSEILIRYTLTRACWGPTQSRSVAGLVNNSDTLMLTSRTPAVQIGKQLAPRVVGCRQGQDALSPGEHLGPFRAHNQPAWTERNPIESGRQSAKRMRTSYVLTPKEIRALLKKLPEPLRTAAELDAFTGLRRGELIELQWADVDFQNLVIHVRRCDDGSSHSQDRSFSK